MDAPKSPAKSYSAWARTRSSIAHRHWISTIGAFSVGYSHLLPRLPVGIGADVTLYHIPTDLEFFYAPSRSFHVFIQWRPRTQHIQNTCH